MGIFNRQREFLDTMHAAREGRLREAITDGSAQPQDSPTGNVRVTDAPPTKQRYTSMQAAEISANRYRGPDEPRLRKQPDRENSYRMWVEKQLNTYPEKKIVERRGLLELPKKIVEQRMAEADAHRVARLQEAGIDAVPAAPKPKVKYKSKKKEDKAWLAKRRKARESGGPERFDNTTPRRIITFPSGG
jgi:hypothetical protein